MARKRPRVALGDERAINTPFADLLGGSALDRPAVTAAEPAEPQVAETPDETRPPLPPGLVLSRSRKQRRGKTVTQIDGLGWPAAALTLLARQLSAALGCGASVDDGAIVLQGDQRTRARAWLEAEGAQRVVCSG